MEVLGTTSSTGEMGTGKSGAELRTIALGLMGWACQWMEPSGCSWTSGEQSTLMFTPSYTRMS